MGFTRPEASGLNSAAIQQLIVLFECARDHCTKEEREVIEASVEFRKAEEAHWIESEVGNNPAQTFQECGRAYIRLTSAVYALLATRAKTEGTTKQ